MGLVEPITGVLTYNEFMDNAKLLFSGMKRRRESGFYLIFSVKHKDKGYRTRVKYEKLMALLLASTRTQYDLFGYLDKDRAIVFLSNTDHEGLQVGIHSKRRFTFWSEVNPHERFYDLYFCRLLALLASHPSNPSVGVTKYMEESLEHTIEKADRALYQAKENGRECSQRDLNPHTRRHHPLKIEDGCPFISYDVRTPAKVRVFGHYTFLLLPIISARNLGYATTIT
jgi:GGDEF domain-containing protein